LSWTNDAQSRGSDEPGGGQFESDWTVSDAGVAARGVVAAYFSECARLVEAGLLEQAERRLARKAWRRDADLGGAPPDLVYRTETLVSRARGLAQYGDPDAISSAIAGLLKLWS
jgi:hypothetical protein